MTTTRKARTTSASEQIEQAVHTVLSEIPGADLEDQIDCVFDLVGAAIFDEVAVSARLRTLR